MAEEYSVTAKVYPTAEQDKFSIMNMLEYFEKHGALRVSDLHIKVGTPPAIRPWWMIPPSITLMQRRFSSSSNGWGNR
jgi:hypothetical protein